MKSVKTKDNSITFFNEKYQETYHSISGALEESFKKFVEPCKISNGMKILDVCFGLGYNTLAALHTAKNLKIIALENDEEILKEILKMDVDLPEWKIIQEVAKKKYYKDENYEIELIMGDALETVKVDEKFDTVFLDPFSPKKCPELWTEKFFKDIFDKMEKGSILATYSCAGIVKRNLRSVGFEVCEGPIVGRKSPGTLAKK